MTTFNYYKHLRKSAAKTLIANGIGAKEAFTTIRKEMPYLFMTKAECDDYDNQNQW